MTKISQEDLRYHKRVVNQLMSAQAVARSWGDYLKEKYNANAVDENGNIVDA